MDSPPTLKWDVATTVIEFEGQRIKIAGAARIVLEKFMLKKENKCDILMGSFPANNLIIEYELCASLIELSVGALAKFNKGLWVIIGDKTLRIAELIDDFNAIALGHECIYSKSDLMLISKSCTCQDHRSDLQLVLEMGEGLSNGKFVLKQADNGYLAFEPKDT